MAGNRAAQVVFNVQRPEVKRSVLTPYLLYSLYHHSIDHLNNMKAFAFLFFVASSLVLMATGDDSPTSCATNGKIEEKFQALDARLDELEQNVVNAVAIAATVEVIANLILQQLKDNGGCGCDCDCDGSTSPSRGKGKRRRNRATRQLLTQIEELKN